RLRSANLIVARSSGCNKAGYRAATNRRCQNNGCLANGDAFIQLLCPVLSSVTASMLWPVFLITPLISY
ncbi:hypothetical protein DEO00_27770, partial [Escherichia coli]